MWAEVMVLCGAGWATGALYTLGVFLAALNERKELPVATRVVSVVMALVLWPVFLGYTRR